MFQQDFQRLDCVRYLDKILEQVKKYKLSLNRIEFKIIEDNKNNSDLSKIDEISKVTEIKDSILNYNRLNSNLNFQNFIQGKSNDIALSYSKESLKLSDITHYIYVVELV